MKLCKIQLSMIRGAIGKKFVVKHYKGGKVVVTKYPNMKGIVPSEKQKVKRRLFKRAVQYSQKVFANPVLKEEKRRMLRRPRRLFQALMKEWFRQKRDLQEKAANRLARWRKKVMDNSGHCWSSTYIISQTCCRTASAGIAVTKPPLPASMVQK